MFKSIRTRLLSIFAFIAILTFVLLIFSISKINQIANTSNVVLAERIPLSSCSEQAFIALMSGGNYVEKVLSIKKFKEMDEVKILEEQFEETVITFDIFIKAMIWGSESEAFRKSSDGQTYIEWKKRDLDRTLIVKQPPWEIKQLAAKADIYYAGFSKYVKNILKAQKEILRLEFLGKRDGIIKEKANIKKYIKKVNRYENLVKETLREIFITVNKYVSGAIQEIRRTQEISKIMMLTFFTIVFIVALMIVAFFSDKMIVHPIIKLYKGAEIIGNGNLDYNIRMNGKDEIGELSRAFDRTRIRLKSSYVRLEQEKAKLEGQKRELEKSNQELDNFVYTASHDLRAPLRGIGSFAGFLEAGYKNKLDDNGVHYLERIIKGAERMTELIDDLLALSRISRQKNPYEKVSISDLLNSVIERMEFDIKEHKVDLIIQENMPEVICDRIKMAEVFLNLIDNAIKFSSKENVNAPRVEIGYQEEKEVHKFFIKDNGVGIERQYHEQIFGIFKRLYGPEYEGTGVGLTIVKRIINDHYGSIWIQSKIGNGASFFFTIPKDIMKMGKKLGELLIESGLISEQEIKKQLKKQNRS